MLQYSYDGNRYYLDSLLEYNPTRTDKLFRRGGPYGLCHETDYQEDIAAKRIPMPAFLPDQVADSILLIVLYFYTMTSPIDITTPVQQLIDRIGSEYEQEIIPVQPASGAKTGRSYINVQEKVAKDGGNLVYGWAIWLGDFICEGEHHAVWEDNDGNLTDITPPRVPLDKIMFVPDDRFTSEDKHARNIRLNITSNPLVDHAIMISEMKEYLLKFGTRLEDDNINFNTYTGNMYNHYDTLSNNVMLFLTEGGKFGSPCYCKSSKPYSQCHGKNLAAAIAVDKKNAAKVNEN